jgi:hypothetical protein
MIWSGMMKCPGAISSRSDPTAENATMASQPRCLRAAMLARAGTSVGEMVCEGPCREMKAIRAPEGREEMVIGEEGFPHGYRVRGVLGLRFRGRNLTVSTSIFLLGESVNGFVAKAVREGRTLTQESSCRGGTAHYLQYIQ